MTQSALSLFVALTLYNATHSLPHPLTTRTGWRFGLGERAWQARTCLGSSLATPELEVILIDRTSETHAYRFFDDARKTADLRGALKRADGRYVDWRF